MKNALSGFFSGLVYGLADIAPFSRGHHFGDVQHALVAQKCYFVDRHVAWLDQDAIVEPLNVRLWTSPYGALECDRESQRLVVRALQRHFEPRPHTLEVCKTKRKEWPAAEVTEFSQNALCRKVLR